MDGRRDDRAEAGEGRLGDARGGRDAGADEAPSDGGAADASVGDVAADNAVLRDAADGDGNRPPTFDIEQACDAGLALRVTVLDDRSVRIHYVRSAGPAPERGWIVDTRGFVGPSSMAVDQNAAQVAITTAELVIEASGAACSLAIRDRMGAVLRQEAGPFRADGTGAVSLGRKLDDGEHIYGLGEKTGASDRRGRSFEMS